MCIRDRAEDFPVTGVVVAMAFDDFNGDHRNDIVAANYSGNKVVTLLNTGVVDFSPTTPLNFGKQAVGTRRDVYKRQVQVLVSVKRRATVPK